MCARHLQFREFSNCKHPKLLKDEIIDCGDPECYYSSAHPKDHSGCRCNRWMQQTQRKNVETQQGKCDNCVRAGR